jgi:hypothetical protein
VVDAAQPLGRVVRNSLLAIAGGAAAGWFVGYAIVYWIWRSETEVSGFILLLRLLVAIPVGWLAGCSVAARLYAWLRK